METYLRVRWLTLPVACVALSSARAQSVPPILLGHQATVIEAPPAGPSLEPVAVAAGDKPLSPGDLLTFGFDSKRVSHIGIYVGDGRFVHASSAAGRVIESALNRPIVRRVKPWRGARRVLTDADSVAASQPARD